MRALVATLFVLVAAPQVSLAQGDAAMAAARAATGSSVGKAAPKKPAATSAAKPADKVSEAAAVPAPEATAVVPALQAQGFSYTPEGRRDPFVNLMRRGSGVDTSNQKGPRPSGLKGLGASEVTLKGTMASQGSFVGILQGSDSRTYVVRQGERLYDGTIRLITADAMVIMQQVNDPLSKETHREVRKVLRSRDEAR